MTNRTARPRPVALPLLVLGAAIAASAGCSDDGVVRGAGSIDVPKPTTFYSPQEEAAHLGNDAAIADDR